MPRCGCAGSSCTCLVTGGVGINVAGAGTADNPYVVELEGADIGGSIQFVDTSTVDFTVTGSGTEANPYQVSAVASLSLDELTDVTAADPPDNYVLAWNGTAWVPTPPATVSPGVIATQEPVTGDGTTTNPIGVDIHTDGVWIAGTGTADDPLRGALRSATGTARIDLTADVSGGVTVTFPSGRFSELPNVVGTANSTYYNVAAGNGSPTSIQLTVRHINATSSTVNVYVQWIAVQVQDLDAVASPMAALAAFGAAPGAGLAAAEPDVVVTCPTEGCANQGVPIPVSSTWTDEEGTVRPAQVVCGVCGANITDTMQPIS